MLPAVEAEMERRLGLRRRGVLKVGLSLKRALWRVGQGFVGERTGWWNL